MIKAEAATRTSPALRYLDPWRLTEADLAAAWAAQRFPREALRTVDGRQFRVVFRGRPGAGPGPDFRGAVLAWADGLAEGDVELHVRTSDFARHGHGADAAYDGVVLHAVLEHDLPGAETLLACGRRAPVVALGRALREVRLGPLAGPPAPAGWQEPCRSAQARLGPDEVAAALARLGEMRFRAAAAAWGRRLPAASADGLLWAGIVEALGYGGAREAFRRLSLALPWSALAARVARLPAAAAGRAALGALVAAFPDVAATPSRPLRPRNRPGSRLQGAAALAARFAANGPAGALLPLLALPPERAAEALTAALCVPRLVGRPRAVEMLTNAVLPIACALGGEHGRCAAEAAGAALPLPARYGAVRHLHEAAAGLPATARGQQGMLYLLKNYCTQGGCGRCPLS